jgi:N-acyl-phosphatidylethanolamine-hydrolysing phospholipase D
LSTTLKMSSMGGAGIGAGLYAAISTPTQGAAQPEDAKDKAHHLKGGFTNPWDSYVPFTAFQVFKALTWSVVSWFFRMTDLLWKAQTHR